MWDSVSVVEAEEGRGLVRQDRPKGVNLANAKSCGMSRACNQSWAET